MSQAFYLFASLIFLIPEKDIPVCNKYIRLIELAGWTIFTWACHSSSLFCLFEPLYFYLIFHCLSLGLFIYYFFHFLAFLWEIKLSKANYTETQKFSELVKNFWQNTLEVQFLILLYHIWGRGQNIRSESQAFQLCSSLMFQTQEKHSICKNWYHIPIWRV